MAFKIFNNWIMKRAVLIFLIIILLYLWIELGIGIFFQDSWGGN